MSEFTVVAVKDQSAMEFRVDPDEIARQIRELVEKLGAVFSHPLGLPLKTMEVSLTITAEGKIGFLGTGTTVTGEGSITLTFEKAEPK